MSRRGRPPHPDILTPREWETLDLLRQGLSNEEIAQRLGISLSGAKYHVSEILSKLGVSSREEAARWSPGERPWWMATLAPIVIWRKLSFGWLAPVVTASAAIVVAGGIGLLVWGLLVTRDDDSSASVGVPLALPAGDRLAYVGADGNLWVLDDTGPARRLTDDGDATAPRWSPDGGWLLFVRRSATEDELQARAWLVRPDGSGAHELDAPDAVWSPSGDKLAYIENGGLWVTEPHGEAEQILPDVFGATEAAWSPDGRRLALARVRPFVYPESVPLEERGPQTVQIPRDNGVYLIDTDGGEPQALAMVEEIQQVWAQGEARERPGATPVSALGVVGVSGLQWSPDGRAVAFQALGLSASMTADGLPLFTVAAKGGTPLYHGIMLRSPALLDWFPDGSRFVFTLGGGRDVYWGKRLAIGEVGVPGAQVIAEDPEPALRPTGLATEALDWPARSDAWPVISPDGQRVAFQASEARRDAMPRLDVGKIEGSREGIWVVDADGANLRQLTFDPDYLDFYPRWSADGELVMFVRTDGEGFRENGASLPGAHAEIWLVRPDGSEAKRLTSDLLRISSYYGLFDWDDYVAWHRAPANP
ncbi:MAG: PD40 domain-containing protein [Chloroflexi bacterium]|nr:PD40 domain-containing protein [Chloroflexota bacterium]